MKQKSQKNKKKKTVSPEIMAKTNEMGMIEGILEGSPDGIGVAVVRLECGCKKMAAVDKNGDPASKVIIYRDAAENVCDKCKEDNGDFSRVLESFIHWTEPEPPAHRKKTIEMKVLGSQPTTH
ncbi:MAG: hypothetical protein KAJ45_06855 [Desulfobulbaceae bacterium]|nr:hypothetical protein [Desulfobulbaceae bacterium]